MKLKIVILFVLFFSVNAYSQKHLVILYVNDTHSRIEPLPASDSRDPNTGGMARNEAYIESVRAENPVNLVLHAGDFVQGTPYFNIFKGEVEVALMNKTKFDAACLGNHEFDYGFPVLEKIVRQAKFPIVSTNYDFSDTPLRSLTKKYLILKRDGIRIGIIGLGVDPDGLVAKPNFAGMKYLSPIKTANETALYLKQKEKCDLIICLSHLGYLPDTKLAPKTANIDIIIGGHSHTFLKQPEYLSNAQGKEVLITQMGKSGIYVGRLDVTLSEKRKGE